jgi:hypothetical protein
MFDMFEILKKKPVVLVVAALVAGSAYLFFRLRPSTHSMVTTDRWKSWTRHSLIGWFSLIGQHRKRG